MSCNMGATEVPSLPSNYQALLFPKDKTPPLPSPSRDPLVFSSFFTLNYSYKSDTTLETMATPVNKKTQDTPIPNTSPVTTLGNDGGVLCLGAFRTGTYSMTTALNILGIDRVLHGRHMATWGKENPQLLHQWANAAWVNLPYMRVLYPDPKRRRPGWLRPEFVSSDTTTSFNRQQWDTLLADYHSIADVACLYPESLIKAYPRAKVILCYRDPDKWAASMDDTLVQTVTGWPGTLVRRFAEPLTGTFGFTMRWDVLKAWFGVKNVTDMRAVYKDKFEAHYAAVRALVPPEQLLEYRLGDGWGPLCEFLGTPEPGPGVPFPRVNDGKSLRRTLRRGMATTMLKALWIVVRYPVMLGGLWFLVSAARGTNFWKTYRQEYLR
ncbi:hypothetical protein B0T16DRAFT_414279 [Cercophora newfieldiana]|uniref:Sulfotransferase n=1 Tax=Cercophora newfieldiana TaxID=92897 RepID=A0AA40CRT4_9PEZI|nr:hypothetical protein B0T16DRAFT_414279 [Cercophora newfieldiana]